MHAFQIKPRDILRTVNIHEHASSCHILSIMSIGHFSRSFQSVISVGHFFLKSSSIPMIHCMTNIILNDHWYGIAHRPGQYAAITDRLFPFNVRLLAPYETDPLTSCQINTDTSFSY